MNRDILEKILSFSDDREALLILTNDSRLDNDKYFHIVFGRKYPNLIQTRKEGESLKHLYLESSKMEDPDSHFVRI